MLTAAGIDDVDASRVARIGQPLHFLRVRVVADLKGTGSQVVVDVDVLRLYVHRRLVSTGSRRVVDPPRFRSWSEQT